jgi:filamentous hemagglutinin
MLKMELNVIDQEINNWLCGERPRHIPAHWIGSPTVSLEGYRWDDPDNPGNSVRIFKGDPSAGDPAHRAPFVIVVSDGQVLDRTGAPVTDAVAKAEALSHI